MSITSSLGVMDFVGEASDCCSKNDKISLNLDSFSGDGLLG